MRHTLLDTPPDLAPTEAEARAARRYRCAGCWHTFPEDALEIVPERTGRGFRCAACLESARQLVEGWHER